MYYAERWVDGVLYIRTSPTGDWRKASDQGTIDVLKAELAVSRSKVAMLEKELASGEVTQ